MTPYLQDPDVTLFHGDVLEVLRELPAESVDCVVTSPPYWGLRDYGTPGQLGLEPTPEKYVERMVEVFREVRRVLASHGTVWLNLGDSYGSGVRTQWRSPSAEGKHGYWSNPAINQRIPNTPAKQLLGMPWRVAFALQQPYYAGRIKSESDRRWLAGIVDSEGCIHIHRRKAGTDSGAKFTKKDGTEVSYARTKDTYGVMVSIDNTSKALVDACEAIIGQGSRYVHEKATGQQQRKQTLYRLTLTGQQSRELLRELYPFLIAKQHEARIAYHSPSNGDEAAACHQAIKALHNGGGTTVDYKAPATLYEPGWYLRSDIIWGKSNPMPESVTDRPTKAHEYVFLLSKQPRYFFDQEAVREEYQDGTAERYAAGYNASWKRARAASVSDKRNSGFYGSPEQLLGKAHEFPSSGSTGVLGESLGGGTSSIAESDCKPELPQTLDGSEGEALRGPDGRRKTTVQGADGSIQHRDGERWPNGGRNIRSVWEIATQPYPEAHFATFPEELARRCIAAGTSERGKCPECGAPWARQTETQRGHVDRLRNVGGRTDGYTQLRRPKGASDADMTSRVRTLGWEPTCSCVCPTCSSPAVVPDPMPTVVLDPFMGSGTVAYVARKLGRHAVGIDLSAEYLALAARRLQQQSLFAVEA